MGSDRLPPSSGRILVTKTRDFPKIRGTLFFGVLRIRILLFRVPYFLVLIRRILLFRVLYEGPEAPTLMKAPFCAIPPENASCVANHPLPFRAGTRGDGADVAARFGWGV